MNGKRTRLGILLIFFLSISPFAWAGDLAFTQQPQDETILVNETVTLSSQASSTLPISYQWFKSASPIPGQNNPQITIQALDQQDGGEFRVQAKTSADTNFSRTAVLTVLDRPIVGITAPVNGDHLAVGLIQHLAVTNSPAIAITNVSFYNGVTLLGSDGTAPFELSTNLPIGDYTIRAVAWTARGTTDTSAPVSFHVEQLLPQITLQPRSQRALQGRAVSFIAEATGAGSLVFQWSHASTNLPGATNATLALSSVSVAQAGVYKLTVSSEHGQTDSDPVTLQVDTARYGFMQALKWSLPTRPNQPILQTTVSYSSHGLYNGLAYGNGVLVAVSIRGYIARSADGINWEDVSPPFTDNLTKVRFLNGVFIVTSESGAFFRSTDGLVWTRQLLSPAKVYRDVAFKDGLYVAIGDSGASAISTNGINWAISTVLQPNQSFDAIATGNGRFITLTTGGNTAWVSTNGTAWTQYSLQEIRRDTGEIAFFGGHFVTATETNLRVSTDGQTWTPVLHYPSFSGYYLNFAISDARIMAFGWNGAIAHSVNGVDFIQDTPLSPSAKATVFTGSSYLMVCLDGNGLAAIAASLNGLSWSVLGPPAFHHDRPSVQFIGDRFFVAGESALSSAFSKQVEKSSGAGDWTERLNFTAPIAVVIQGDNQIVASSHSQANLFSSTNGVDFSPITPSGNYNGAYSMTFAEGEYLAANDLRYPNLLRSTDAAAWNPTTYSGLHVYGVTKGNGKAVAVGSAGNIWLSENGAPWESIPSGTTGTSDNGAVVYSWDGINWEFELLHTAVNIYDVAYGNGSWLVGGRDGVLLQTTPVLPSAPTLAASSDGSKFNLQIFAQPGSSVTLEESPDLSPDSWTTVEVITATSQPIERQYDINLNTNIFFRATAR